MRKNWLLGKDSDAGKDWRQEKGMTGWDGWMVSLIQWTWAWVALGVGDGQGDLACCSPWGCKESDMTERLNWTELNWILDPTHIFQFFPVPVVFNRPLIAYDSYLLLPPLEIDSPLVKFLLVLLLWQHLFLFSPLFWRIFFVWALTAMILKGSLLLTCYIFFLGACICAHCSNYCF